MRLALPLLLLGGCARWAEPTAEDLRELASAERMPAYVRGRAAVDVESSAFAGRFTAALVARTGADPAVRLQLIPDVGGKAVDLLVTPARLRGRFPQTGEEIDWALPEEARPHPLLFIGLTVLEEFAPAAPRVTGRLASRATDLGPVFRVRGLVPPTRVELLLRRSGVPAAPSYAREWEFGWRGGSWILRSDGRIEAPNARLRIQDRTLEEASPDVEALLK